MDYTLLSIDQQWRYKMTDSYNKPCRQNILTAYAKAAAYLAKDVMNGAYGILSNTSLDVATDLKTIIKGNIAHKKTSPAIWLDSASQTFKRAAMVLGQNQLSLELIEYADWFDDIKDSLNSEILIPGRRENMRLAADNLHLSRM